MLKERRKSRRIQQDHGSN